MLRKTSLIFLVIIALFLLLTACGIPQIFIWDDSRDSYSIRQNLITDLGSVSSSFVGIDFTVPEESLTNDPPFRGDFPHIYVYYTIRPNTISSVVGSFNSSFRESTPPTPKIGDPIVSRSTTFEGVSINNSLYEMRIRGTDSYLSSHMKGESFFTRVSNSEYSANWTIERLPTDTGTGFYFVLVWQMGDGTERRFELCRKNGEAFYTSVTNYCNDSNDEFAGISESVLSSAGLQLDIYLTFSFSFKNYTNRVTMPLDSDTRIFTVEDIATLS